MKYLETNDKQYEAETFDNQSFLGSEFYNCIFVNCSFEESLLTGTQFIECQFFGCSFDGAYIFRTLFKKCEITDCTFYAALVSTVDFSSSTFVDVKWRPNCEINKPPVIIDGIEYPITAFDNGYMQVGCHYETYKWFWETDEKHSAKLEGLKARKFWKKNKAWIFEMLKVRGLYGNK